jgi:hypothetical protein
VSFGAELVLLESRLAEDGVGVGINEAWSEHTASAIDDLGARVRVFKIAGSSDCRDATAADCDRGVAKNPGFPHLSSPARPGGAGAGNYLGCVYEEQILQGFVIRESCGIITPVVATP